jgi:acetolactate synthase-1/2/3 large subunit
VSRHAGQLLVDQLAVHGAELAFTVPGESFLPVLDGFHGSPLRLIVCRHEANAANMAAAYAKLTGQPGICLVTRGPGATQASVGVHTAYQDSMPMILLVGQVAMDTIEREGFQEVDYRQMFGSLAKWAAQIESAERIPELISRAFSVATSGRPGPVVLSLPEDVLAEEIEVEDALPYTPVREHPGPAELERMRALLAGARRPLAIVGGGGWTGQAAADTRAFCEANEIPVAASYRCQDYVDNRSRVYAGHLTLGLDPKLAGRVREADLLLVLGARLGEITTSDYTLVEPPNPRQTLVHTHADADELGRVYRPELAIVATPPELAAALRALPPVDPIAWREETRQAREDFLANMRHDPMAGDVDLAQAVKALRERLPDDALITNGAGNHSVWVHRFWEYRDYGTQLAATSGSMGYGFPAAVAAKLVHPQRAVVCVSGDGDFLMSASELATAVRDELALVVVVVNNSMYGTIRMHQEHRYPDRVSGTDLFNPDFAELARSFGAYGEVVPATADFPDALERALAAERPAVLEVRVDPEQITPRATLAELRAAGRA